MLGLVWAILRHADVVGLISGKLGKLGTNLVEVKPSHLFVKLLGQDVNANRVVVLVLPEVDLCKRLVGEAVGHHEAGVAGGGPLPPGSMRGARTLMLKKQILSSSSVSAASPTSRVIATTKRSSSMLQTIGFT